MRECSSPSDSKVCECSSRFHSKICECPSRFDSIEIIPPDPILGVYEAFLNDPSPIKLNLGIGAYRTEDLQPYVLDVVKKAEQRVLTAGESKEYLPLDGLDLFRKATVNLLLGEGHAAVAKGRVAAVQSLSGTGSLRVGSAFLARFAKGLPVYLPNPTWVNHHQIFGDEGIECRYYRYFDPKTIGLDFEGMVADLEAAQDGSVILLHGCAHNPTGIDPTPEQWESIAQICLRKNFLPFFDVAYQGFATGDLDKDAFAPRLFISKGMEAFVAQSYSKNMGLYGERVGALVVVTSNPNSTTRLVSQLKRMVRTLYSNPPAHGARIVATIINDPDLFAEWKNELHEMAGRLIRLRKELQALLEIKMPERDWSYLATQIGMFSFTGLTSGQVEKMTNKHHVYMTRDGRISLAGLNSANVSYLADAIIDSIKTC